MKKIYLYLSILLILSIVISCIPPALAQEVSYELIDGFEDDDMLEYSGEMDYFSITEGRPHNGTYGLNVSAPALGENVTAYSTDGLSNYPSAGLNFSYWFSVEWNGVCSQFYYGFGDNSWYRLNVTTHGLVQWATKSDGSYWEAEESSDVNDENQWYKVRVNWAEDGSHHVKIMSPSPETTSVAFEHTWECSNITSGGMAWGFYNSDFLYADGASNIINYDDFKVEEVELETGDFSATIVDVGRDYIDGNVSYNTATNTNISLQYRVNGTSSWSETSNVTVDGNGTETIRISGLDDDTEYEIRGKYDGNVVQHGEIMTATTLNNLDWLRVVIMPTLIVLVILLFAMKIIKGSLDEGSFGGDVYG